MEKKVLFIEDDIEFVGPIITRGLQAAGYNVYYTNVLAGLQEILKTFQPDLVLLDLEIGNENSTGEIPLIRNQYPSLPILIASSHTGGDEVSHCLDLGATYYIKKPYEIQEILTLLHRYCPDAPDTQSASLSIGSYHLDIQTHVLQAPDQTERLLNPKEFQLLSTLVEHLGKVIPRTKLLQQIWHNEDAAESLNNNISHLRSYLKEDPHLEIRTIKKTGYQLLNA